ncbi:MAG TPA: amino acid permease [Bryobacteraceae bacterium]
MKPPTLIVNELPRKLGMLDATVMIIGIVIGAGIFVLPNLIARDLPSAPAVLSLWIVSGILSVIGALAYAELGAMMPVTGGLYVYLREAYGPLCAFVSGWTFMLAVMSGGIAFLAVMFSLYAGRFIPLTPLMSKVVSLALLTVLSAVNVIGVREGAWVQRTFTFLKIAGLVTLIGAALFTSQPAAIHMNTPAVQRPLSLSGFGMAMTACLMVYNGWSYVSFIAGEIKDPARNLLRSLVAGMAVVMALYVFANVAYMKVMSISEIAATERVGAEVATRTMGAIGGTFVSLVVLISITGALNGCILTAARVPFAQARDGLFFSRFGRMHPRSQTPAFAIVVGGIWTAVLIVSGSYETLYSYSILAAWIFYTLGVLAVSVFRRTMPDAIRPYRMWGYPYTVWAFVCVSVWFILNALVMTPRPSLAAFGMIAIGAVAYRIWRKSAAMPFASSVTPQPSDRLCE